METDYKTAIIVGAGPAGLTAALEFCRRSAIRPIVLEASNRVGGISCTIRYKGNRIDIGGHRFFSKSDRVMNWWTDLMPLQKDGSNENGTISYHNEERSLDTLPENDSRPPADPDLVMLVRPRKSRIYFMRTFFDYPLSLSASTLRRLGFSRTIAISFSYAKARLIPRAPEKTLEDFLINRFGEVLYNTFFKSYTEKVWGVPCNQIDAAWGAQRIKGLSLRKAVVHFLKQLTTTSQGNNSDIRQKASETSLIEKFLYPKFGPGQMWERAADLIEQQGGEVRLGWRVTDIDVDRDLSDQLRINSVTATAPSGASVVLKGDYFFSTMPVQELIRSMKYPAPKDITQIAAGLVYRDFITVGLLVDRLLITEPDGSLIKDTWIYVQEPDVLLGRIQIFNNWSSHLVSDPSKVWIGLEYFCNDTDAIWKKSERTIADFAIAEIASIGILRAEDVRDWCVFRVPKTYPAYFGTYDRFDDIVAYTNQFENLFLVGRNGMHKYNNQDHSMLTAMVAVDNILAGVTSKSNLWEINTEQDYHEKKQYQSVSTQSAPSTRVDERIAV